VAKRFVITCHDAGGTIPPVLALGEALVARGNEVTVLSQPSVRRRAEAAGCTFVAFSSLGDYDRRKTFEEQLDVTGAAIVGREVGDDLRAVGADADVMVVDANLAGALAAAESLVQPSAVLLHSVYATYVDVWFAELWPLLGDAVNVTRGEFGLGPVDGWPSAFAAHDRLLSVVPAAFDAPTASVPDSMRHFGFLVPRSAPDQASVEFPPGDGPAVLVSLGTTHQDQPARLAAIADALGRLPVRAIITTAGQADLVGTPNVTVVDYTSHVHLLPETDLVVTHGGLGTIAAALDAGVPLVCVPYDRDQPLNSSRVAALGAGVALDGEPTADDFAAAIERVLGDASFRDGAERVADLSRADGGAEAAAKELEELA
jgi:UDP:flavonoid glycosyltransferase YjiC (YdhE family)